MSFRFSALLLALIATNAPLHAYDAPAQLMNPDFEGDVDNVGFPDGWTLGRDAKVTLTREQTASGTRALVMQEGYAAASQNLNITNMANRTVILTLAARSPDGAALGVRFGFFKEEGGKGKKWTVVPAIWNKPLTPEFQTYTVTRVMPADAIDGRFWIGLYRSKREGTVVVDKISLEFPNEHSSLNTKQSAIVRREEGYVKAMLQEAEARLPGNPELSKIRDAAAALSVAAGADLGFSEILKKHRALNADLLNALYPKRTFVASWRHPYERLEPGRLPSEQKGTWQVASLPGETSALGVELANTTTKPQELWLGVDGLSAGDFQIRMRRQVLMETWYTKGETLQADPLTLLKKEGDGWRLDLEPGEMTRVYIAMKSADRATATKQSARLTVRSASGESSLPFEADILAPAPPCEPRLSFYQFLYINRNIANDLPAETARDLESHGVTDIEWAFMPAAKFASDGSLLKVDWKTHDRWLKGFKDSPIRLNIFWAGGYKKMEILEGGFLKVGSPQWKRGLQELLVAYLDHAASLGLPRERFTILPLDELHSSHLDKAPDEAIDLYCDIARAIREVEKDLPQYLTIGIYAFPVDVKTVLPLLNVAMPSWPRPEKLGRNAPPEYNPKRAYFDETLPMLEKARREGGLQIRGYHVLRGKSDDLLRYSLGYPVLAVASGLTGFGYWAYNVANASSWDDLDGTNLDYSLIYDGRENHPLNRRYNITSEVIVPSIQWEAMRAGRQNGQILLSLMDLAKKKTCPPKIRSEIAGLVETAREFGGADGYGGAKLSFAAMHDFGIRLRKTYARAELEVAKSSEGREH